MHVLLSYFFLIDGLLIVPVGIEINCFEIGTKEQTKLLIVPVGIEIR